MPDHNKNPLSSDSDNPVPSNSSQLTDTSDSAIPGSPALTTLNISNYHVSQTEATRLSLPPGISIPLSEITPLMPPRPRLTLRLPRDRSLTPQYLRRGILAFFAILYGYPFYVLTHATLARWSGMPTYFARDIHDWLGVIGMRTLGVMTWNTNSVLARNSLYTFWNILRDIRYNENFTLLGRISRSFLFLFTLISGLIIPLPLFINNLREFANRRASHILRPIDTLTFSFNILSFPSNIIVYSNASYRLFERLPHIRQSLRDRNLRRASRVGLLIYLTISLGALVGLSFVSRQTLRTTVEVFHGNPDTRTAAYLIPFLVALLAVSRAPMYPTYFLNFMETLIGIHARAREATRTQHYLRHQLQYLPRIILPILITLPSLIGSAGLVQQNVRDYFCEAREHCATRYETLAILLSSCVGIANFFINGAGLLQLFQGSLCTLQNLILIIFTLLFGMIDTFIFDYSRDRNDQDPPSPGFFQGNRSTLLFDMPNALSEYTQGIGNSNSGSDSTHPSASQHCLHTQLLNRNNRLAIPQVASAALLVQTGIFATATTSNHRHSLPTAPKTLAMFNN